MLPWMWESVRKWTSTLPNELPLWELESQWTPKFLENDCKGQNPLDCGVHYIIGNFLERKPMDTSNTTYGQKKGWESNWQFDSRPLKVRNRPDFVLCRWCVGKFLMRATTFLQTSFQSKVCTQSYGPPKSQESQLWEFRRVVKHFSNRQRLLFFIIGIWIFYRLQLPSKKLN